MYHSQSREESEYRKKTHTLCTYFFYMNFIAVNLRLPSSKILLIVRLENSTLIWFWISWGAMVSWRVSVFADRVSPIASSSRSSDRGTFTWKHLRLLEDFMCGVVLTMPKLWLFFFLSRLQIRDPHTQCYSQGLHGWKTSLWEDGKPSFCSSWTKWIVLDSIATWQDT